MIKAGYTRLREELDLLVPPLGMDLALGDDYQDKVISYGQGKLKLLAKTKKIGDTVPKHIETAIKHQGIRLSYLVPIFEVINAKELTAYVAEKPTSEIRRCIWYLYEWLTSSKLDLPDSEVAFTKLADDRFYYTRPTGLRDKRTRVENNLLGNKKFCPMIRKTTSVKRWARTDLMRRAIRRLETLKPFVDTEVLGRSVAYLYTKETKSSTEIEKEDSREEKTKKFFRVLKNSGTLPLNKARLLFVQNQIVNTAHKDENYRDSEIYVGVTRYTLGGVDEDIHFIGPKKDQVPSMMEGLLEMHEALMLDNELPAMMHAALVSFGLVYIHPFSDGNGRTHRYLIHDITKSRGPEGQDFIIPVSASILQNPQDYDRVLETLSKPIMAMIDYEIEDDNSVVIQNDLNYLYRYPDLTPHVEFLYKMMRMAINVDLIKEVLFIVTFDGVKSAINGTFDMPNKQLDLLVQILVGNEGRVGRKKRKLFAALLSGEELDRIEGLAATVIAETAAVQAKLEEIEPDAENDD
jgi:hypothetical protein